MAYQPKHQVIGSDGSSGYVIPNDMSDIHNIRLRNPRANALVEPSIQFSHLTLNTDDYQWNEPITTQSIISRYKHSTLQIVLLILTALSYCLYALRAHIPNELRANSSFLSSVKPVPIARVYTSDIRPDLVIENSLLRLAEICQALWLIYILSYIPRRSYFGYIYRFPNIFNSLLCTLLLISLSLEVISQIRFNKDISCACLFGSLILLMFVCRLVTIKLVKYQEKIQFIDFMINRYFILNSIFLYTTVVAYLAINFAIEQYAHYLTPYIETITLPTTLGLSIAYVLLIVYFLFDRFIYENEFWPIWTPYLFITMIFICPPLRHFITEESQLITEGLNYYLLWILFLTTIIMMVVRIWRQIYLIRAEINKKRGFYAYKEQASIQAET